LPPRRKRPSGRRRPWLPRTPSPRPIVGLWRRHSRHRWRSWWRLQVIKRRVRHRIQKASCLGSTGGVAHRQSYPPFRRLPSDYSYTRRAPGKPWQLGLERVSADIRTHLCSRVGILPGKGSVRPETGAAFLASLADSGRQRPGYPASPAAKPRRVKDFSAGARKPELRRSAWWSPEDSNCVPGTQFHRTGVS
jgi:hypothetical protein